MKKIVVGADHGGFVLKEKIKIFLEEKGKYKVDDVGTFSEGPCDYPQFGYKAAEKVSAKKAYRGIIICKSGVGMAIVANKLPGVRAAVCTTEKDALSARQHNDTNVLVLAAAKTDYTKARKIAKVWLDTSAEKGRHARRVRQIRELETKLFRCSRK